PAFDKVLIAGWRKPAVRRGAPVPGCGLAGARGRFPDSGGFHGTSACGNLASRRSGPPSVVGHEALLHHCPPPVLGTLAPLAPTLGRNSRCAGRGRGTAGAPSPCPACRGSAGRRP